MRPPHGDSNDGQAKDLLEAIEATVPSADQGNGKTGVRQRTRDRVTKALDSAEEMRSSSLLVDTLLRLWESNRRIPVALLAGALASRLVFYVIPFLVLTVVGTGLYSSVNGVDPIQAARAAGLAGLLASAVDDSSQGSTGFQTATVFGMATAALWAANSLARLVRSIHALVWSVPLAPPRRPWLLPIVVLIASIAGLAISHFGLKAPDWPTSVAAGEVIAEVALCTAGWLLILRFLPRDPEAGRWFSDLPGALLVGVGLIGMKAAVIFYLAPRMTTLGDRYGDVASAVLVLTWAYWLAFIIVIGVALNASFSGSRRGRLPAAGVAPADLSQGAESLPSAAAADEGTAPAQGEAASAEGGLDRPRLPSLDG